MIANYHTHTSRCHHARGTEEEYAKAAFDGGLKILGFSDHTPWFSGNCQPGIRMRPEQLGEYCDAVRSLQKEYAGKMQIHLGLEVENYSQFLPELVSRARDQGVEYFLLAQHWLLDSQADAPYCGSLTEDKTLLRRYCEQVIKAVNTGLFSYVAHPDLIRFSGDRQIYRQQVRRLCREANSCGIPLEINLLGLREGRHYPNRLFWQVAGEENCCCVIGCDAHSPETVYDPATYAEAVRMAKEYGLSPMEMVELRPIG